MSRTTRSASACALVAATALALAGCQLPGTAAPAAAPTPTAAATMPAGQPTSALLQGPVRPSATTAPVAVPTVTVTDTVLVATAAPAPSASPRPSGTQPPLCAGWAAPARVEVAPVAAGGAVRVSWRGAGTGDVVRYRVAVRRERPVTGQNPEVVWKDVPAGSGCAQVTTTVGGLAAGTDYEVWLTAMRTGVTHPGLVQEQVGRSAPFTAR